MAETTGISWADATLNYWIGCQKVSPACDHCYAERDFDHRKHRVQWGPHGDRSPTKTWRQPYVWQRQAAAFFAEHGCRRRVFINSLSDFADNHRSIEQGWRDEAHRAWRECPDLDFLILTKRPQNLLNPGILPADWGDGYPNVWLGTTVENQAEADRRVPQLLAVPARIRFLSCEPLLGVVNLEALTPPAPLFGPLTGYCQRHYPRMRCGCPQQQPAIDWVITGGESGPGARPSHPDWFRSLRDQCAAAGVAFHHKQNGEWAPMRAARIASDGPVSDRWGNVRDWMNRYVVFDNDEGAARVRGHSFTRHATDLVYRVGTKRSGHLLDGVEHRAVPS